MRKLHSTVAAALLALLPAVAGAQPNTAGGVQFTVFLRGTPVGFEDVNVTRSAEGTVITGSSRLGPPLDITVRRAEIRYDASGRPLSCFLEGAVRQRVMVVSSTVSGTTATTDVTEGTVLTRRSHEIGPDSLLLPNLYFSGYEAFAARLSSLRPGDEVPVYVPGQGQATARVGEATDERIQTPAGTVKARRHRVTLLDPAKPLEAEIWADENGRLVRFIVSGQALDVVRSDIASVSARREAVTRPGDESIRMPANGFTLAGTLSKPAAAQAKGARLPAVILVGGVGASDRDEVHEGIPVFGQLASALADAGFIVVRYDRRGIGQSGGRAETAVLGDYAEDVRSVVRFLRKRRDVDRNRVAVLGYDQGGSIAMTAARRDGDIKAMVLAATPGVPGRELVLEQQREALAQMNLPDEERQKRIEMQRQINDAVLTGKGWAGVPPALRKQAETPWFQSTLAFDPAEFMSRVRQPVLIVHGALDRQLGTHHAETLASLARGRKGEAGERTDLVIVPGANHQLAPSGDKPAGTAPADQQISPEVVSAITGWLGRALPAGK
ncbi:MAG TPA: alpha/beta fold hydrolase [Vicinamibacterales bacterium]|nr:alpha/beta fold hydrolase [Vicinamibacterales bacterium]